MREQKCVSRSHLVLLGLLDLCENEHSAAAAGHQMLDQPFAIYGAERLPCDFITARVACTTLKYKGP
jgi:hypothetical protein